MGENPDGSSGRRFTLAVPNRQTGFEVRVRSGFLLSLAGLAVITVSSIQAQTTPAQTSQPPAPSVPIPTPQSASPDVTPSRPAYDPDAERRRREKEGKPVSPTEIPQPAEVQPPVPAPPPTVIKEPPPPGKPKYTQKEIYTAYEPYGPYGPKPPSDHLGSTYIPVDSWVYPEMMRLYGMGFIDRAFLSVRPWTRRSVVHLLQDSQQDIMNSDNEEAQEILAVLLRELTDEQPMSDTARGTVYGVHSTYSRLMGVGGNTLRDSFHLGQTLYNDYGRPYAEGFNNSTGFSALAEHGRFSFYVRGEYQHSPASTIGYSQTLSAYLSFGDQIAFLPPNAPQATIPTGPIPAQDPFRILEADLSVHYGGHEFSFGKTDAWLGPGMGGAMAWSNNAENIWAFRINRVEPLHIPVVSALLGPIRYDFFYGSLQGHTYPNHPYVHSEILSLSPTRDLQFGIQRTIIFGGAGHEPVTIHTFLKGFFDPNDTTAEEKNSRDDPGARFSSFTLSYRLPYLRKYATFYIDSETHDDLLPISAPRRAGYRTGLFLSHLPHAPQLDFRVEAASTDCSTLICTGGGGNYRETIQRQGYTNKGFIFGDWIGREAKGGQAWLTWNLSGNEFVQVSYLNKKTPYDFIAGGTTQNQFKATVVKRFGKEKDIELNGWLQYERWKAPVYLPGLQGDVTGAVQVTWFPKLHSNAH